MWSRMSSPLSRLSAPSQSNRMSSNPFQSRQYSWRPPPWPTPKKAAIAIFKAANFVLAVHIFAAYVARPSFMSGPSMLPTFANSGEMVIEEMLTYRFFPHKLARGDLITLESPIMRGRLVCKRLIGLPGDIICVDPTGRLAPSTEHVVVPKGHVWISGDNAAASRDSRMYGPVPIGLIKGKIFARIWPLRSATIFRNETTFLE